VEHTSGVHIELVVRALLVGVVHLGGLVGHVRIEGRVRLLLTLLLLVYFRIVVLVVHVVHFEVHLIDILVVYV